MSHISYSNNVKFAGSLFLVAIAASLTGGTLIHGVLDQPDFISHLPDQKWTLIAGVSLEIVNALAVIGIAAALWTPLRRSSPAMTIGYFGVRVIEAGLCTGAAFIPITQMNVAKQDNAQGIASLLTFSRESALNYAVPIFFGVSAVILYLMLYKSALVPKYIAVWGLVGAACIIVNVFVTAPAIKLVLVLPIITNEIYLGIHLITKGLRPTPQDAH